MTATIVFTLSDPITEARSAAVKSTVQADLNALTAKVESLLDEREPGELTVTEIVMNSPDR